MLKILTFKVSNAILLFPIQFLVSSLKWVVEDFLKMLDKKVSIIGLLA